MAARKVYSLLYKSGGVLPSYSSLEVWGTYHIAFSLKKIPFNIVLRES